jgi:hypothetical protein
MLRRLSRPGGSSGSDGGNGFRSSSRFNGFSGDSSSSGVWKPRSSSSSRDFSGSNGSGDCNAGCGRQVISWAGGQARQPSKPATLSHRSPGRRIYVILGDLVFKNKNKNKSHEILICHPREEWTSRKPLKLSLSFSMFMFYYCFSFSVIHIIIVSVSVSCFSNTIREVCLLFRYMQ